MIKEISEKAPIYWNTYLTIKNDIGHRRLFILKAVAHVLCNVYNG